MYARCQHVIAGDSPCLKLCMLGKGIKSGLLLPLPGAGAGLSRWPGSSAFTPGLPPARAQLRIAVVPHHYSLHSLC